VFFVYVYTEAGDNVGGEAVPITVSDFDQKACLNKNIEVIRGLVESEGLDWDTVTRIEVETGEDMDEDGYPDADNPHTEVCYSK
jgi:hypothetical protein